MLTQFLRLRIAPAMTDAANRETTATLREALGSGQSIEVAGYEVAPALAAAIGAAEIAVHGPGAGCPVDWFELVADEGRPLSPASLRVVDAWTDAGVRVTAAAIAGDAFWSIQETTLVPGLLDATTALFRSEGL